VLRTPGGGTKHQGKRFEKTPGGRNLFAQISWDQRVPEKYERIPIGATTIGERL